MRTPLSSRWSKEREIAFLEHLALSSNVAASERVARLTRGTAHRHRRTDAEFARRWDEALREGYGRLEAAMLNHAINGVEVVKLNKDGSSEKRRVYPERIQMLLFNAHRERVSSPQPIEPGTAREKLAARLAEMRARTAADA